MVVPAKTHVAVVGVDFESTGDDAIITGLRLLAEGALDALHLLHVLDPRDVIPDPEQPTLQTEEEILEVTPPLLKGRARELASAYVPNAPFERVSVHTRLGRPVDTLLQMCVDYDAELLIVGTHARRGFDRLLLGSVANDLITRARCPLLIARRVDYTGLEKTKQPDPPYPPGEEPPPPPLPPSEGVHSTERESWHPSDNGPTGFRIV
jgi:nucleotide-binding universal stress UspA family protein